MQNAREEGHVIARVTDNTKNMHSNTIGQLIEYPWNLSNREFISHQVRNCKDKLQGAKRRSGNALIPIVTRLR